MGLITGILTLPLAPGRGAAWIAEQVRRKAERQWRDPAALQEALTDVQARREAGLIDDAEAERLEDELIERLLAVSQRNISLPWVRTWRRTASCRGIVRRFVRVHGDPVARGEGMSLDRMITE
jgi:Gas vesicle protein G